MQNFKPELIHNPGPTPPGFQQGLHPEWVHFKKSMQLVDPSDDSVIAHWSYKYNRAYFVDYGFFHRNPNVAGEFKFEFDPEKNPFPEKIGNFVC